MKYITYLPLLLLFLLSSCAGVSKKGTDKAENSTQTNPDDPMNSKTSVHDFSVSTIDGEELSLSEYKGKKMLIVNVASKCGYTPQYADLEEVYDKYKDEVVILGFPANNFGGQEPGSDEEIKQFCTSNYGVSFPMFSKISVKGKDQHPLYSWLSSEEYNGWNNDAPNWNFCKYLIDENGKLLKFYKSGVTPSEIITQLMEKETD